MNLSFIPWYYKTPVNISKGKSRYLLYECRFNRYFFRTTLNFKIMYLLEFKDCRFLEDVFMFSSVPIFSRGFATLGITSPEPQSTLILYFIFVLGLIFFNVELLCFLFSDRVLYTSYWCYLVLQPHHLHGLYFLLKGFWMLRVSWSMFKLSNCGVDTCW